MDEWIEIPPMPIDMDALKACQSGKEALLLLNAQWEAGLREHDVSGFTEEQTRNLEMTKNFLRDVIIEAFERRGAR